MRWILSIVTALCLLAAASDRPDPRHGDGSDASQLTLAKHGTAPAASPRRAGTAAHHARIASFVATAALDAPAPPDDARALVGAHLVLPARDARPRTVAIRGPPRG